MSWDVLIINLPPGVRNLDDLGENFDSKLESLNKVRIMVTEAIPEVDFSDPSWGSLESDDYSIEFSIGDEDPCTSMMLHVRGTEAALQPIQTICTTTGWHAFDCSDGELINWDDNPGKGLLAWRAYRDKVLPGAPECGIAIPLHGSNNEMTSISQESKPTQRPWWKFWK